MRRLIYVPIIHSDADLGSLATTLVKHSTAVLGMRRWKRHEKTVCEFWEAAAAYFRLSEFGELKVYQDGLVADGEIGKRIVEEGARRGSRNYKLILELLEHGAELRKTEDPSLLLQEQQNLRRSMLPESAAEEENNAERYQSERDRLMAERDRHIADTINATLKEGELGALFIGAQHNVMSRLAEDISVEAYKDPCRVRAYFEALFQGVDKDRLEQLARYLTSAPPVGEL